MTELHSPTRIATYYRCPFQYYLIYVRNCIPQYEDEAENYGLMIHRAIQRYYEKISDNVLPSDVSLIFGKVLDELKIEYNDEIAQLASGFIEFEKYRLSRGVRPKPIAVEKMFEKPPFMGIVDAIFQIGDEYLIVDWKSSFLRRSDILTEDMYVQGAVYRYITGIRRMWFVFLRFRKVVELPNSFDEKWLMKKYEDYISKIRSNIFPKRRGRHCDYCPVSLICYIYDHYNYKHVYELL